MLLIALLLIVEGLSTGVWIARAVPVLDSFGLAALLLAVLRIFIGAMQLVGGVFLIGGRPSAFTLSRTALIASAVVTTFEIGARITPTNLVPDWRWPLVIAYWIYAAGAAAYLGYEQRRGEKKTSEVVEDKGSEVVEDKGREVGEEKNAEVGEVKNSEVRVDNAHPTDDPTESGHRPRLFE